MYKRKLIQFFDKGINWDLLKGELEFEVNGFGKTNVNWT
jgi:uncharacterized phage-like protein YoqJ